ncbi:MAG: hypothetical protein AB1696_06115 [Planctomycetota bacterium]
MKTSLNQRRGISLIEILVVICVLLILASALIVGAMQIRGHAQLRGTESLIAQIQSANEQFQNEWRFYAPDSPIAQFGGINWTVDAAPSVPEFETVHVESSAPGMPGDRMPTQGNEYLMINLAVRSELLRLSARSLAGPERIIALAENRKVTRRCILMDGWGRPIFYDCHVPEGGIYANGLVRHNMTAFDLFSLGKDGRTGSNSGAPGDDPDDLNNWQGSK